MPVRIYRRTQSTGTLPGVLWLHGGGYVIGGVEQDDLVCQQQVAAAVGCVVVSVDYRLAPEHPFPAPLEDCYAALPPGRLFPAPPPPRPIPSIACAASSPISPRRTAVGPRRTAAPEVSLVRGLL